MRMFAHFYLERAMLLPLLKFSFTCMRMLLMHSITILVFRIFLLSFVLPRTNYYTLTMFRYDVKTLKKAVIPIQAV